MSSENEGGRPPYGEQAYGEQTYGGQAYGEPAAPGAESGGEPTAQFDAFRARRADEREQQETQTSYTFPPEYAADPGTVFPPAEPPAPPYAPYGAQPGRFGARRWRSAAIFGGAVLVACALGLGVWAAFDSSGSPASGVAAGTSATGTAAGTDAGAHTKALTFRVTIQSVGADSFTGKVMANGETVTVALTDKTRYGTKAHAFSQSELTVGETVIVHGRRTGTDTVTASLVAANTDASSVAAAA